MRASKAVVFEGAVSSTDGMTYRGVLFQPVVEKCEGCNRVSSFEETQYCSSYASPAAKWSMGTCNFATHTKTENKAQAKVNPLKASKRAAGKK